MKIKINEIAGWEPAVITFRFDVVPNELIDAFRIYVTNFLQCSKRPNCFCIFKYIHFHLKAQQKGIEVHTEWMCSKCLQKLANAAVKKFPSLNSVEFGIMYEAKAPSSARFIEIPARKIKLEDGTVHSVGRFTIARTVVTIDEFRKFAGETGYLTTAELDHYFENYQNNQTISGLSSQVAGKAAAVYLSYRDATAFCQTGGYRLPTEKEWLAAAIKNWKVRDVGVDEEFDLRLKATPRDLIETGNRCEWTADKTETGDSIVRCGPTRFLNRNWNTEVQCIRNRRILKPNSYQISLSFRVVLEK